MRAAASSGGRSNSVRYMLGPSGRIQAAVMTVTQFGNGYWYAIEIKEFAKTIGIPSANKLRKDELGKAIKLFLETGKIKIMSPPTNWPSCT